MRQCLRQPLSLREGCLSRYVICLVLVEWACVWWLSGLECAHHLSFYFRPNIVLSVAIFLYVDKTFLGLLPLQCLSLVPHPLPPTHFVEKDRYFGGWIVLSFRVPTLPGLIPLAWLTSCLRRVTDHVLQFGSLPIIIVIRVTSVVFKWFVWSMFGTGGHSFSS